jgi:hypothetical protein
MHRITKIKHFHKKSYAWSAAGLLLIVVLAGCMLTNGKTAKPAITEDAVQSQDSPLEKDLNGDGTSEKLIITGMGTADQPFVFTVNGKVQQLIVNHDSDKELTGIFEVVDLNTSDKVKQIAFPERGPSGQDATSYFRLDAGTGDIAWIGTVPGSGNELRYLGNGQVLTSAQRATVLSTWFHEQTYTWTKQNKMELVKQDLYKTNIPVTLKKTLPLYVSRTNDHLAGTLKPEKKRSSNSLMIESGFSSAVMAASAAGSQCAISALSSMRTPTQAYCLTD